MNKFKIHFLVAFLTFGLGLLAACLWLVKFSASPNSVEQKPVQIAQQVNLISAVDKTPPDHKSDRFRVIVPKAHWEKIFFEEINKRIRDSKLTDLRSKALPEGDLEIRVWRGFGLTLLEGFVLSRTNGEWSAKDLGWKTYKNKKDDEKVYPSDQKLNAPASGWETAWEKLTRAGILSLPDAEEINCSALATDGMSYVVEYNLDNVYRTYMYDNPALVECVEAKKIVEINKIISTEFYNGKFNLNE